MACQISVTTIVYQVSVFLTYTKNLFVINDEAMLQHGLTDISIYNCVPDHLVSFSLTQNIISVIDDKVLLQQLHLQVCTRPVSVFLIYTHTHTHTHTHIVWVIVSAQLEGCQHLQLYARSVGAFWCTHINEIMCQWRWDFPPTWLADVTVYNCVPVQLELFWLIPEIMQATSDEVLLQQSLLDVSICSSVSGQFLCLHNFHRLSCGCLGLAPALHLQCHTVSACVIHQKLTCHSQVAFRV